ncbi:hypothetical protein BU17DRAFT_96371 [Hysterangium stoloniferum]|nr:hypothetical protein BU17DRAFT_96371 [Hysterangium stoloniferum]
MSRLQRYFPLAIAGLTGIASGIYIFKPPLEEQATKRRLIKTAQENAPGGHRQELSPDMAAAPAKPAQS